MRVISFSSVALFITSLLGCVTEMEDGASADDETLAETQSALSLARWYYGWGTVSGPDLDLGPASEKTCFLAGVAGNLNVGWPWDEGGRESVAGVWIDSNGNYKLAARGGLDQGNEVIGNPVNARVVCIGTTAGRKTYYYGGPGKISNTTSVIEPVVAGRECFLSYVSGFFGTWAASNASVRVRKQNGNWVFGSSNLGTQSSNIPSMKAVCVNLPRATWAGTGVYTAATGGVANYDILGEATAGACGLTGLTGALKDNDWDDGALIAWPSSSPGMWKIRVEDGKAAHLTCVH